MLSIEINDLRILELLCFAHRVGSRILVGQNIMLIHEVVKIHARYEATSFNFLFFELEWESDFRVTWKSDSKCCTLVGPNSGFEPGVGVGTPRAHTP